MITAQDDFEECLDLARQLLSGSDDVADLWEANDLCNRALRQRPKDAVAWLVKAQVLLHLDDECAALAAAEMALRRLPRNPEAHYLHASALSQMGRFDDALRSITRAFQFSKLTDADPSLVEELYFEKAAILDAMERSEEAESTFELGLQQFPDSELLKAGLAPLRRQRLRRSFRVLNGGLA